MSGEEDLDDSDLNPAPCSSGYRDNYSTLEIDEDADVDSAITSLLSTLRFAENRHKVPTEADDEQLRRVHERIVYVIARETDDVRRRRLRRASPCANTVREQILYLRRLQPGVSTLAPSYYPRLSQALDAIVKDSFDEEYRKVAIVLGVVDAVAEVLALEVSVFGMPTASEHRTIRKFIANALTNLTYGHVQSKRRLCSYSGLIPSVVRIIVDAPNLAQVYAGLVRNLSWMADPEMATVLSPSCRALAKACVQANSRQDEPCLRATLSALWNLASHSADNKRSICDEPACLEMLATLLTPDARMTVIVESASGILKYASQYLSGNPRYAQIRIALTSSLVLLLNSASFTIVANSLSAISNLIAKDLHLQNLLRGNATTMMNLNVLRNSAREDIRAVVKSVLNHLNQPSAYNGPEMSSSLCHPLSMSTSSRGVPDASRLLPLRSSRASPGANLASLEQRSCSLPRQFARAPYAAENGGGAMNASAASRQMFRGDQHQHQHSQHQSHHEHHFQEEHHHHEEDDSPSHPPQLDYSDDLSDSLRATRCTSAGSLASEPLANTSGWESVVDTAANSTRMSPVSYSELPDSPTQCALLAQFGGGQALQQRMEMHRPLQVTVPTTQHDRKDRGRAASDASRVASDATTTVASEEPTPTFAPVVSRNASQSTTEDEDALPGPSLDEDDYACLETGADLLDASIAAVLPQLKTGPKISAPSDESDRLLTDMIEAALPTRRGYSSASTVPIAPNANGGDRLLMDAIMSAMPSSSPAHSPFHPKNVCGGRTTSLQQQQPMRAANMSPNTALLSSRPPPSAINNGRSPNNGVNELVHAMQSSALVQASSNGERVRDASRLEPDVDDGLSIDEEVSGSSEEEWSSQEGDEIIAGDLPADVVDEAEEEALVIECKELEKRPATVPSTLPSSTRSPARSSLPRPTTVGRIAGVSTVRRTSETINNKSSPSALTRLPPPFLKPKIAPKPNGERTTKAVVTPYNYQKPKTKEEDKPKENVNGNDRSLSDGRKNSEEIKPNSKQMLVTTV